MMNTNNPQNTDKDNAASPSLGKLDDSHAMKRLNHLGHWASERKGQVRVVEFHEQTNGDSQSVTYWFKTWTDALEHYGMATNYAKHCTCCGHPTPGKRIYNPLGQWVCLFCYDAMNETKQDLFFYSQGRWKL